MSDSEHLKEVAPFPWKSRKGHSRGRSHPYLYRFVDAQDLTVLLVPGKENTGTGDRAKEIAEYVLHAANSHEELLAACQYLCAEIHNGCNRKDEAFMRGVAQAEAIIRKAERG